MVIYKMFPEESSEFLTIPPELFGVFSDGLGCVKEVEVGVEDVLCGGE